MSVAKENWWDDIILEKNANYSQMTRKWAPKELKAVKIASAFLPK